MSDRAAVRLQDVAEHAGVSLATASRMLGKGDYGGRAALRERVIASAEELGYRPNPHARALAKSASSNVGLVVHDVRDAYFALITGGVITVAENADMLVNIVCTFRDPARELEYVRRLSAQRVRAIVLAGSPFRDRVHNERMQAALEAYENSGGSVVSISRGRSVGHVVDLASAAGMRRLTDEMVALGHRRFGVIAGPMRLYAVRDRVKGIRQSLKEHGITLAKDDIAHSDLSRDGGLAGAQALMSRAERPTCLIAVADVTAIGAMSWLRSAGYRVPDDVSVAGFGGIPAALDAVPALTTMEFPLERAGESAMELALRPARPRHVIEIEGTYVPRGSTAPPPR